MLRLGIVDFDSSHAVEFTRRFNHVGVAADRCVAGARVVLGWPGNSLMAPERILQHQPLVVRCGVELVREPEEMLGQIDAVLILSLCGAVHFERARVFLEHRIPTFIDKPFANCWEDACKLALLARQQQTLLFHASGLRYTADMLELQQKAPALGRIEGAFSYGPGWQSAGNPGLLHYGIHTVEQLFTLLGRGCVEVQSCRTAAADIITGQWADGRMGTVRVARAGHTGYGLTIFSAGGILQQTVSTRDCYTNLCRAIVASFQTSQPAVRSLETLEVIRFILAAERSLQQAGATVQLSEFCIPSELLQDEFSP